MRYKKIEISELAEPAIQCSDELIVGIDKKKSLLAGVVFVGVAVLILVLSYSRFSGFPIWVIGFMILIGVLFFVQNLISRNPVFKIDITGITLNGKEFYDWDGIKRIVYELDLSNEGTNSFIFYLSNNLEKKVADDGFLDKPISVIATHIDKYFNKK